MNESDIKNLGEDITAIKETLKEIKNSTIGTEANSIVAIHTKSNRFFARPPNESTFILTPHVIYADTWGSTSEAEKDLAAGGYEKYSDYRLSVFSPS